MAKHNQTGSAGELLAANYLETHGYILVDRNVNMSHGEIDILAREGGDLVFIEVKTRTSNAFGTPAEGVTASKLKKINSAITEYLHTIHDENNPRVRFDVVSVLMPKNAEPEIELIKNAAEMS